jgi:CPA1 family monovalent cation:H+ antiporter
VAAALLLGAMVAPTDPVAVVGLFKKMGVPDRLTNLVEAESLANDGTGVVLFTIAVGALTTGQISAGGAVVEFVRLASFGLALGVGVGLVVSLLTSRVDDFQVEISLTALAAYGSYLLADLLHVSGILAVVAAGVVLGSFGRPRTMSPRTQDAVELFWDYVAFLLNSLAFLLVGLEVPYRAVLGQWQLVLLAALIALLARAVTVYGILGSLSRSSFRVPPSWQHILVWGGVRGVIAVALVLSLSGSGGEIGEVRALVYGVMLISIVVQGLTIGPLARYLLRDRGGGGIPSA